MNKNKKKNGSKKSDSIRNDPKKLKGGFQTMGLHWQILKSILNSGYKQPTPIQRKAIPEILLGKDVVAMARTGSGKTAAFLLPMFQRLHERVNANRNVAGPKALIMSPTRELALQTFKFTKQFGKYSDFKAAVILGGDKIEDQFETLHENPDIIIATPGRFLHICIEMNMKLNSIEYVVFDEADRLFEMGFKEQLNEILHKLPIENRQTLLFSATMPQSLVEFARAGLQNPVLIRLDVESKLSDKLKMTFLQCRLPDKLSILIYLLNHVIKPVKNPLQTTNKDDDKETKEKRLEQTLIFVATKHHVEFLRELLECLGYCVSYAYSSLDQTARQINIAKFQNKKTSIMIVTDVAARGIDIPMLDNVINFNFPSKAKLFVHRVGRVARAGQFGNAISLVTNDELPYMHELFEFLSKEIRFAVDDMSADDWNEVYGSVPQSIIDIEKDSLKALIDSREELKGSFQVQENAYKHYLKTRPLADSASVRAAKNIRISHPVLAINPIFKNSDDLDETMDAQTNLLDQLKNYSTKATIFEINKTSNTKSALIMRKKRECHDRVVEKFKSKDLLDDNLSLFQKNKYSVQSDAFKNDKDDDFGNEEENESDTIEEENGGQIIHTNFNDQDLVIKITNNDNYDGISSNLNKNNGKLSKKAVKRLKQAQIIDTEHFIPYKPKNFLQEKALGINNNFNREISNASLDLVVDDENDMRKVSQKTKWDRKKKKYVSLQSTLDKNKKIKTESGQYINASYKSDLYSKWLKNSKANQSNMGDDDDENEDGNRTLKKNKKYFGSSLIEKKYFGSHKYKSTGKPGVKRFQSKGDRENPKTRRGKRGDDSGPSNVKKRKFDDSNDYSNKNNKNKRFKVGLKNKDQIIKERNRKAKVQAFQNKRGGGKRKGSGGGGGNKKSFRQRK